jgi:hypothetical protein
VKDKIVQGYAPVEATIAEMSADGLDTLVMLDPKLVKDVVDDDPSPMFVTIEVLNESVSKNGRFYDAATIHSIAAQINSKHPDGYSGHLSQEERSFKNPDTETIWLGAVVKETAGKVRLFAKGYVLPEAKQRRSYLKRAMKAGKSVAVSVYGTGKAVYDRAIQASRISNFTLESVDWARSGSEGVSTLGLFSVTAEMNNSNEEIDMKREDVLKSATVDELRDVNPELVSEMTAGLVPAIDATVITEMAAVKEVLGDNPLEAIAEMQASIRENTVDAALATKVRNPAVRRILKRVVMSEMAADSDANIVVDTVLGREDGKALIREMTDREPSLVPTISRPEARTRKYTSKTTDKKGK